MTIKFVNRENIEISVLSYIVQKKDSFEEFLLFPSVFINPLYREMYEFIKKEYEVSNNFALSKLIVQKDVKEEEIYFLYNAKLEIDFEELKVAFIEYAQDNIIGQVIQVSQNAIEIKEKESNIKSLMEQVEDIKTLEYKEKNTNYCLDLYSKHLEERKKQAELCEFSGVSTGISTLDNITMGLKDGEYVLVAARPSMGKTSLATEFFISAMKSKNREGVNVLFSLEMPVEQIMGRIITQNSSNLTLKETIHGVIQKEESEREINDILEELNKYQFIIEDYSDSKSRRTIERIESQLKTIEKKYGKINFIEIDYVQLVDTERNFASQRDKITYISNKLQQFSKMFKCPIVVLSQLNRELEKRIDKRPILSDLRDSGSLEQDADIVIFIYRKEVYLEAELKEKMQQAKGDVSLIEEELNSLRTKKYTNAELIVRKNRNGPTGIAEAFFIKNNTKIVDTLPVNIDVHIYSMSEVKDPELQAILYEPENKTEKENNNIEILDTKSTKSDNNADLLIEEDFIDIDMPDIG